MSVYVADDARHRASDEIPRLSCVGRGLACCSLRNSVWHRCWPVPLTTRVSEACASVVSNIQDVEAEKFRRRALSFAPRRSRASAAAGSKSVERRERRPLAGGCRGSACRRTAVRTSCDLSLLAAYSVSPGEPVTVAYHAESKRWAHIVEVEDQRREAVDQWLATYGLRVHRRGARSRQTVGLGRATRRSAA